MLSGKQSHLGSLIKSHAKMVASSLYTLPFTVFLQSKLASLPAEEPMYYLEIAYAACSCM